MENYNLRREKYIKPPNKLRCRSSGIAMHRLELWLEHGRRCARGHIDGWLMLALALG